MLVLVCGADGEKLAVDHLSNDTAKQFFIIHLRHPLSEGKQYLVSMSYVGNLNDMLQGFYRSSYTVNNQTR
jgi:aminopeptidase N